MSRGKLYIITGTSAVGKSTVARLVLKKIKNLARSLTFTSRQIRGNEKDGRDYHFISKSEFEKKIAKADFLEWANNYGNLYGTDKKDMNAKLSRGINILIVIDIKGALNIKKKWSKTTIIFILPESINQLSERFKRRRDTTAAETATRLKTAKWELEQATKCDYWVINRENRINQTADEITKIINHG
jgi:guanylate kinase